MTMGVSVVDVNDKASARQGLHQQIRAEFLEMPGLNVTLRQAARLWNIDVAICASVLGALVDEGFLSHSGRDAFRRTEG